MNLGRHLTLIRSGGRRVDRNPASAERLSVRAGSGRGFAALLVRLRSAAPVGAASHACVHSRPLSVRPRLRQLETAAPLGLVVMQ